MVALLATLLLAAPALRPDVVPLLVAGAPIAAGGPRAAAASMPLLGVRYQLEPLGEGKAPDADPRFRLDAFDCVTFVETATALGVASNEEELRRALDDIRYGSRIDIADRDHEVISQWIPRNVAKGWVVPLSRQLAGASTIEAATVYDKARWERLARKGRRLTGVPPELLPIGRFATEVVPPSALAAVASRIPDGTVLFVVRGERTDQLTRVTHAGLVVVRDGQRLVRHASSSPGVMRVVEEPLARFTERQRHASSRPLTGLAFYAVRDNRARLATLPPLAP